MNALIKKIVRQAGTLEGSPGRLVPTDRHVKICPGNYFGFHLVFIPSLVKDKDVVNTDLVKIQKEYLTIAPYILGVSVEDADTFFSILHTKKEEALAKWKELYLSVVFLEKEADAYELPSIAYNYHKTIARQDIKYSSDIKSAVFLQYSGYVGTVEDSSEDAILMVLGNNFSFFSKTSLALNEYALQNCDGLGKDDPKEFWRECLKALLSRDWALLKDGQIITSMNVRELRAAFHEAHSKDAFKSRLPKWPSNTDVELLNPDGRKYGSVNFGELNGTLQPGSETLEELLKAFDSQSIENIKNSATEGFAEWEKYSNSHRTIQNRSL